MGRPVQRFLDLLVVGTFGVLPVRLGWSRRTSKTLCAAAIVMGGLSAASLAGSSPVKRLASVRHQVAGLFLIAAQYQLTEEESHVRGAVALIGVALILVGSVVRLLASDGTTSDMRS